MSESKDFNILDFTGFLGGICKDETDYEQPVEEDRSQAVLDEYEEKMKTGEIIPNVSFTQTIYNEGAFFMRDGVRILMPPSEISEKKIDKLSPKITMGRKYNVIVYDIDREKRIVYVSFVRAQLLYRDKVIAKINEALEKGETFIAEARVNYIQERKGGLVILDILGLGIPGLLHPSNWSYGYVETLAGILQIGDIIKIKIIGKRNHHDRTNYNCSHKLNSCTDEWKGVEERYPLHSNVVVECVALYEKYFVGRLAGDEITAYCYYPDSASGPVPTIRIGHSYRGFVKKVKESTRLLQISILEEFEE